jgi:hypothetical protein
MKEIREIQEIIDGVEETWLANDGGLTAAACDVISFGRSVIRAIERKDIKWLWTLHRPDSTGAEIEIGNLAIDAAHRLAKEAIKDRIDKDPSFLAKVIDIFTDQPRIQFHEAEGPGKFYQLSVRLNSWNEAPNEISRNFGQKNEDGEKWLLDMPLNFIRK